MIGDPTVNKESTTAKQGKSRQRTYGLICRQSHAGHTISQIEEMIYRH